MLSDVVDYWCKSTFRQKLALIQQGAIQVAIIIVAGFVFFWGTFVLTWVVSLLIGVQPYLQISSPNFHMRSLMPDSLLTIYVNPHMKRDACAMGPDHLFFSELTVPHHEYCNIEQLPLPTMKAKVDITIEQVETDKIVYVTSCIKHLARQVSCQKYPATQSLLLFRNVDFYGLYYLQVELHLKKSTESFYLSYTPKIRFQQQCGFLSRFIKQYYTIFMFIFSYGITALLTLAAIAWRLAKIVENCYKNKPSAPKIQKIPSQQQTKDNVSLKSSTMSIPASVLRSSQISSSQQSENIENMRKQKMIKQPEPTNDKNEKLVEKHEKDQ